MWAGLFVCKISPYTWQTFKEITSRAKVRQKPWVALEFSMCVFCHLLEKDHQAWQADRQVEEGVHPWPLHPSLRACQSIAKLIKCHDALGFLLNHPNLQVKLSQRDLPPSLLSSGLATSDQAASGACIVSSGLIPEPSMLTGIALKYFSLV